MSSVVTTNFVGSRLWDLLISILRRALRLPLHVLMTCMIVAFMSLLVIVIMLVIALVISCWPGCSLITTVAFAVR